MVKSGRRTFDTGGGTEQERERDLLYNTGGNERLRSTDIGISGHPSIHPPFYPANRLECSRGKLDDWQLKNEIFQWVWSVLPGEATDPSTSTSIHSSTSNSSSSSLSVWSHLSYAESDSNCPVRRLWMHSRRDVVSFWWQIVLSSGAASDGSWFRIERISGDPTSHLIDCGEHCRR